MAADAIVTGFGTVSQALRVKYGKRIIDQAEALNVSPSYISNIETGQIQPDQGYVERISSWLHLDILEKLTLIKGLRRATVVDFDAEKRRRKGPTLKLYRQIHTLSPAEIRSVPTVTGANDE